jgi:hypothetical protein
MIWSAILRAVTWLSALFFARWASKREGAREVLSEIREEDRARADEIRDRVDAVRRDPVRVRPDDTRGYRD